MHPSSIEPSRSHQADVRPTALITGASSGIGLELARVFAHEGHDLILVARNARALDELAERLRQDYGIAARGLVKDLSQPTAPEELFSTLQREGVQVEVLVNNAGFGLYGPFVAGDFSATRNLIQVNLVALTHLTKLFVEGMIKVGHGKILNVSSMAAFLPGPLMAIYYASKAYVLSFSEALDNELRGTGVTVTTLCPGPTRTDFQRRAGLGRSTSPSSRSMSAEGVAWAGYRGLMRKKPVVVPGLANRFVTLLVRLTPRRVVTKVVRAIQGRRE